jgi:PEGA domain
MRKRLADIGYQVVDNDAMFELSGTVRKLTYDVKARDEINISIASTLRDVATGKLLWSGIVDEKKSRFAGIVGNNKSDVVRVLRNEIGVVTKKTSDQIGGVLMAQHPDLFGIVRGTVAVPGVTVLNAPNSAVGAQAISSAKGKLIVGSRPQGAKVYVDDVYYGMSPLHLGMDPGIHTVTVELDGYGKVVQKVSVRKGDTTDLELKLKKR